jgi:hypothetical protein
MTTGGVDSGILGDCIDSVNRMAVDTIFVQVAAFRDPEYLPTLHSMIARAEYPERLRVGACLQYDWDEDEGCFDLGYPKGLEVDEIRVDALSSQGLGWARSVTQSLYQGEQFTLQIDSHTRFVQGWDSKLLQMWKQLRNKQAIITHYAPRYDINGGRNRKTFSGMGAKNWRLGTLWFDHAPVYSVADPPTKPPVAAFISGHFLFGSGEMIERVPYDPWLQRHGEESSMSVRLWTHGYDFHCPNQVIMWHRAARGARVTEIEMMADYEKRAERSAMRACVLLAGQTSDDPEIVQDLEHYGLGSARTLSQYQEWAGVDFRGQAFTEDAAQASFKPFRAKKPVKMVE